LNSGLFACFAGMYQSRHHQPTIQNFFFMCFFLSKLALWFFFFFLFLGIMVYYWATTPSFIYLGFLFSFFWGQVLLYSQAWPWTHDPPTLVSQVLGLQVLGTLPSSPVLSF
jgi:hypothetical protein